MNPTGCPKSHIYAPGMSFVRGSLTHYTHHLTRSTPELYKLITEHDAWEPALNADGDARDGADVAELTGILDLTDWPKDMRVIVRRERFHPGAQLLFDDVDGYRLTAFATNTRRDQLQTLELRHRRRARCEDRIRNAKDTGLRNLPLHGFNQNWIWCQIVAPASDLLAWAGLLAHPQHEVAGGNQNGSASDCSRSPRPSHATAAGPPCTWRTGHTGATSCSPRSTRCAPCPHPAAETVNPADHDPRTGDPPPQRHAATVIPSCQNRRHDPGNDAEHHSSAAR